jgi:hypothetical protein
MPGCVLVGVALGTVGDTLLGGVGVVVAEAAVGDGGDVGDVGDVLVTDVGDVD